MNNVNQDDEDADLFLLDNMEDLGSLSSYRSPSKTRCQTVKNHPKKFMALGAFLLVLVLFLVVQLILIVNLSHTTVKAGAQNKIVVGDLCDEQLLFNITTTFDNPSAYALVLTDLVMSLTYSEKLVAVFELDALTIPAKMGQELTFSALSSSLELEAAGALITDMLESEEELNVEAHLKCNVNLFGITLSQEMSFVFPVKDKKLPDAPPTTELTSVEIVTNSVSELVANIGLSYELSSALLYAELPSLQLSVFTSDVVVANVTTPALSLHKGNFTEEFVARTSPDSSQLSKLQALAGDYQNGSDVEIRVSGSPYASPTCMVNRLAQHVSFVKTTKLEHFDAGSGPISISEIVLGDALADSLNLDISLGFNNSIFRGVIPTASFEVRQDSALVADVVVNGGGTFAATGSEVVKASVENIDADLAGTIITQVLDQGEGDLSFVFSGAQDATDLLSQILQGAKIDIEQRLKGTNPATYGVHFENVTEDAVEVTTLVEFDNTFFKGTLPNITVDVYRAPSTQADTDTPILLSTVLVFFDLRDSAVARITSQIRPLPQPLVEFTEDYLFDPTLSTTVSAQIHSSDDNVVSRILSAIRVDYEFVPHHAGSHEERRSVRILSSEPTLILSTELIPSDRLRITGSVPDIQLHLSSEDQDAVDLKISTGFQAEAVIFVVNADIHDAPAAALINSYLDSSSNSTIAVTLSGSEPSDPPTIISRVVQVFSHTVNISSGTADAATVTTSLVNMDRYSLTFSTWIDELPFELTGALPEIVLAITQSTSKRAPQDLGLLELSLPRAPDNELTTAYFPEVKAVASTLSSLIEGSDCVVSIQGVPDTPFGSLLQLVSVTLFDNTQPKDSTESVSVSLDYFGIPSSLELLALSIDASIHSPLTAVLPEMTFTLQFEDVPVTHIVLEPLELSPDEPLAAHLTFLVRGNDVGNSLSVVVDNLLRGDAFDLSIIGEGHSLSPNILTKIVAEVSASFSIPAGNGTRGPESVSFSMDRDSVSLVATVPSPEIPDFLSLSLELPPLSFSLERASMKRSSREVVALLSLEGDPLSFPSPTTSLSATATFPSLEETAGAIEAIVFDGDDWGTLCLTGGADPSTFIGHLLRTRQLWCYEPESADDGDNADVSVNILRWGLPEDLAMVTAEVSTAFPISIEGKFPGLSIDVSRDNGEYVGSLDIASRDLLAKDSLSFNSSLVISRNSALPTLLQDLVDSRSLPAIAFKGRDDGYTVLGSILTKVSRVIRPQKSPSVSDSSSAVHLHLTPPLSSDSLDGVVTFATALPAGAKFSGPIPEVSLVLSSEHATDSEDALSFLLVSQLESSDLLRLNVSVHATALNTATTARLIEHALDAHPASDDVVPHLRLSSRKSYRIVSVLAALNLTSLLYPLPPSHSLPPSSPDSPPTMLQLGEFGPETGSSLVSVSASLENFRVSGEIPSVEVHVGDLLPFAAINITFTSNTHDQLDVAGEVLMLDRKEAVDAFQYFLSSTDGTSFVVGGGTSSSAFVESILKELQIDWELSPRHATPPVPPRSPLPHVRILEIEHAITGDIELPSCPSSGAWGLQGEVPSATLSILRMSPDNVETSFATVSTSAYTFGGGCATLVPIKVEATAPDVGGRLLTEFLENTTFSVVVKGSPEGSLLIHSLFRSVEFNRWDFNDGSTESTVAIDAKEILTEPLVEMSLSLVDGRLFNVTSLVELPTVEIMIEALEQGNPSPQTLLSATVTPSVSPTQSPTAFAEVVAESPPEIAYFINRILDEYDPVQATLTVRGPNTSSPSNILEDLLVHFSYSNKINDPTNPDTIVDISLTELSTEVAVDFVMWPDRNCFFSASVEPLPASLLLLNDPKTGHPVPLATGEVNAFLSPTEPIRFRARTSFTDVTEIAGTVGMLTGFNETLISAQGQSRPGSNGLLDGLFAHFTKKLSFHVDNGIPSVLKLKEVEFTGQYDGDNGENMLGVDIHWSIASLPLSFSSPAVNGMGDINSSRGLVQATVLPMSWKSGTNITTISSVRIWNPESKRGSLESEVNSFISGTTAKVVLRGEDKQDTLVQQVLRIWEMDLNFETPTSDIVDGGVLPEIQYEILDSAPNWISAGVQLEVDFPPAMDFLISPGAGNFQALSKGVVIASVEFPETHIHPGHNIFNFRASLTAENNRKYLQDTMSALSFGAPIDLGLTGQISSDSFTGCPVEFTYAVSLPEFADGTDSPVVACNELESLNPNPLSWGLCNLNAVAATWMSNPLTIPLTVTSLKYTLYFNDPDGYSIWFYDVSPKDHILLAAVSEPGTLSPPALPLTISPGNTSPIRVAIEGGSIPRCLRLYFLQKSNHLYLDVTQGEACLLVEKFEVCVKFVMNHLFIDTTLPTCKEQLGIPP